MWPWLFGAGALAAVMALSSKARASEVKTNVPEKLKKIQKYGRSASLMFTRTSVPWYWSEKKQKQLTRTAISETPAELVAAASHLMGHPVSVNTLALATLMASEAGNQPDVAKVAIGHAALTYASNSPSKLTAILLAAPTYKISAGKTGRAELGAGHFGSQQGRYAATSQAPNAHDIELAENVLRGTIKNPTPGAKYWDSPATQDAAKAKKIPGYDRGSQEVAAERKRSGLVPVYLASVAERDLRLWRPA